MADGDGKRGMATRLDELADQLSSGDYGFIRWDAQETLRAVAQYLREAARAQDEAEQAGLRG